MTTTANEFDSILEQCLSEMATGKVRFRSCLPAYPELAEELAPLLQVAEAMWAVSKPTLSPESKAQIEGRLLEAAEANRLLRPAGRRRRRVRSLVRWAFSGLAVVLVFMVLAATAANAAPGVLPGSPLYPVKLATETTWLWLAPERDEAGLHLRFAMRRLREVEAMIQQGSFDPSVLEAMTAHLEAALDAAEDLPPALALPVLEDLVEFTAQQQQVLARLPDSALAALGDRLAFALRASQELARRAQAFILLLSAPAEPGRTGTLELPSHTPEPPSPTDTSGLPGPSNTPGPLISTGTPEPLGPTQPPQMPGPTSTSGVAGPTGAPEPPTPISTPRPSSLTSVPEPVSPSDTPEPPTPIKTKKTPEPPQWGHTKTPKPSKTPGR